ncbi:MAG: hypothetical protein U0271_13715 [Polyangiaceae bacterium]
MLDRWALRREKVLHLIDLRAAKQARELASRCRRLARARAATSLADASAEDALRLDWLEVRAEVGALLAKASPRG